MGLKQLLYGTVLSAALTVSQKYIDDGYPVKSDYHLKQRNFIERIDAPGFPWEGNDTANWVLIAVGLWFLNIPAIAKYVIFSSRLTIPVFYNVETPFNTTFLLIGASGLIAGDLLIAAFAFLKVVVFDLRQKWFVYSVFEQKADVASSIIAKTAVIYGYPVVYLLLRRLFMKYYNTWKATLYGGNIAFGISLITWWYIIPYFDSDEINQQ